MDMETTDQARERRRAKLRAKPTPKQSAAAERVKTAEAEHVAGVAARQRARHADRLQEDVTPLLARLLARLLASAGEEGELLLVDGAGQVVRRWQAAEDLARELASLDD
jgi:hypothetical protein